MTDLDLEAIREREKRATLGPWEVEPDLRPDIMTVWTVNRKGGYFDEGQLIRRVHACPPSLEERVHIAEHAKYYEEALCDAEFLAHARTDIPDLLAEVERLRAELQRVRNALVRDGISDPVKIAWALTLIDHALGKPETEDDMEWAIAKAREVLNALEEKA